ncbi:dTDP-4-dehydrorhamnose reductase [Novosphingobium sp. AP12]|uniref:dTDP-4-dehydrorhamnose reductase n=1 Tax=Novosphingobium sp. AP12 TaxID=1144305 RepID=UPI000271DDD0|nr:dTDP-4-dehydrorhamnose reductase [Novosphingobium sp. AP12]EJL23405.1 dTDP-4-dehydrorhamnose reductase [Novosphingobium sp. AP12]
MRIAVTGTRGQVAVSLLEVGALSGVEVVAVGRPRLNLMALETVRDALAEAKPDVIVSAAAYTAVDRAETDAETAHAVNVNGARAVAQAASELGVPLIHLSTDYVFSGAARRPYVESDAALPIGLYAITKLAGERAVAAVHGDNTAILRTGWVYSPFGTNFAKTMLRLAGERAEVGVVDDQFGSPTSALDLARGIVEVACNLVASPDPALRGTFHMTAAGDCSWAEFARALFDASRDLGGPGAHVRAIPTRDYPTPARRPQDSRLDCSLLASVHGVALPPWRAALLEVVERLVLEPQSVPDLVGAPS